MPKGLWVLFTEDAARAGRTLLQAALVEKEFMDRSCAWAG
jgi:hypothetical protein